MGERYDDDLRVTEGDNDFAQLILDDCEAASGESPATCPWRAFADPFVQQVLAAHAWWKTGQLEARYGGEIPASIAWGVDVYRGALNAVEVTDIRADREKREADAKEREAKRPR